ncbi:sugar transport protein 5-like [Macadamia integrifolia]|uniref:sugar transport protein 5-like n=1 Tax=Macadamia integrifolia TaxID=60698 RepID=UPI001C4FE6B2|nr:sugar transport protein 5-like [Macadamia integrifolia]
MPSDILADDNGAGNEKLTASMVMVCIVAASAGMLFGYDVGVSGGVVTTKPFLEKFFPDVLRRKAMEANKITYCTYNNKLLTFFTSSLYLAALFSSLVAGRFSADWGRKATLVAGGLIFLAGTAVICAAMNLAMLIVGRLFVGFGIGFSNQAAPIYLSEMAPTKWRGAFATGFDFFVCIGVVTACTVNYLVNRLKVEWSWRLCLGLAGVPAIIMTIAAFFIPDTTVSLVQRGRVGEAWETLSQVRGVDSDVETELTDIFNNSQAAAEKSGFCSQYRKIFQRQYRPHLVLTAAVMMFQQLTGVNMTAFYGPIIAQTIGVKHDSALVGAAIMGAINLAFVLISCFMVDRVGRRILFTIGGINLCISQVGMACMLAAKVGASDNEPLTKETAKAIMVWMSLYSAGFGYSWGPLAFLIPSEVLPIEVRPAGNGIGISINFLVTFVVAQTFVSMLCHLKFAVFLLYAACIVIMTLFILLFLPETKGIPLESMGPVWEKHWYWGRFVQSKIQNKRDISMGTIMEY